MTADPSIIEDLIKKAAAGADDRKLSAVLTDKLSERIIKTIDTAYIKLDTIDLNSAIKTSLANISFDSVNVKDKFNKITDDILATLSKSAEAFKVNSVLSREAVSQKNLFDTLFKITPEFSRSANLQYQELVKTTITALNNSVEKFSIYGKSSKAQATEKDLFDVIFSVTPEFSYSTKREYQELVQRTFKALKAQADKISLSTAESTITQKDLFALLFKTTPDFDIATTSQYQLLVRDTINTLKTKITGVLDISAVSDISQKNLLNIIFNTTPSYDRETGRVYQDLAREILNAIKTKATALSLDATTPITQTHLFNTLFSTTPTFSLQTSRTYQELVQKTIGVLATQIDKFATTASLAENAEKPTQQWLIDALFHQTPEWGLFSSMSFNGLRMKAIGILSDNLTGIKDKIEKYQLASSNDNMSQQNVIDILFKDTPEWGLWSSMRFNSLRTDAVSLLRKGLDGIKDKIEKYQLARSSAEDSMSQQSVIDILFKDTPEWGLFSSMSFNRLRMDAISLLREGLGGVKDKIEKYKLTKGDDSMSQQNVIDVLFKDTPEWGTWSTWSYNSLRMDAISLLKDEIKKFKLKDGGAEGWTRQDLINILFKQTPEMGLFSTWEFNSLRRDVIKDFRKQLEIKKAPSESNTLEVSPAATPRVTAEDSSIIIALTQKTIDLIGKSTKKAIFGEDDPDLLTNDNQEKFTKDLIKEFKKIADRESSPVSNLPKSPLGASLTDAVGIAIQTTAAGAGAKAGSSVAGSILARLGLGEAAALGAGEAAAGSSAATAFGLGPALAIGSAGIASVYGGYKLGESIDKYRGNLYAKEGERERAKNAADTENMLATMDPVIRERYEQKKRGSQLTPLPDNDVSSTIKNNNSKELTDFLGKHFTTLSASMEKIQNSLEGIKSAMLSNSSDKKTTSYIMMPGEDSSMIALRSSSDNISALREASGAYAV